MTDKLCVFISYDREDQAHAEKLWIQLGEWGFDRWLDVKDIPKGISRDSSDWIEAIDQGLKKSQVVIGLVSPDSLANKNVQTEWNLAQRYNCRLLLLGLRPFKIEDVATAYYINLHGETAEKTGLQELQRELKKILVERTAFQTEFTALLPSEPPQKSPDLPDYLKEKPEHPSNDNLLRLMVRVLTGLGSLVSFIWLVIEPKFEPLTVFIAMLGTFLG
ncbi:MAG: toll/interleukin-1 receptor domain-containing protein, partial [Anaerolineae bacterium]|nr:toll/interleukin-1 receptor domain-containing protein [Anaerolineae bacterium]